MLTRNQGSIDVRSTGKEFRSRKIFEMVLEVRSLIAGILVFQDSGVLELIGKEVEAFFIACL